MTKKRSFGDILSPNISRNCELNPQLHAIIFGQVVAGISPTKISQEFNVSRQTVYNIKKLGYLDDQFKSKPRIRRPKSLTSQDRIHIRITVRRFPDITRKELRDRLGLLVSDSTIRRELTRQRIRK
jgi:transposase